MKMKKAKQPLTVDQKIRRRNFLSFGIFGTLSAAAYGGWKWLYYSPEEQAGVTAGARAPLRRALNKTELFFRRLAFNESHLVKTYPVDRAARIVRHNSDIGSEGDINLDEWRLEIIRSNKSKLFITYKEILALPKTELVFDFKCVEAGIRSSIGAACALKI